MSRIGRGGFVNHRPNLDAHETKTRFDMCLEAARAKGIKIASTRPLFSIRLTKALQEKIAHARGEQIPTQLKFRR